MTSSKTEEGKKKKKQMERKAKIEKVGTRHKYICTYKAALMRAKLIWHSVAVWSQKKQGSLQKAQLIVYGVSYFIICGPITVIGRPLKTGSLHRMPVWILLVSDPIEWLWDISWIEIAIIRWRRCSLQTISLKAVFGTSLEFLVIFFLSRQINGTYLNDE